MNQFSAETCRNHLVIKRNETNNGSKIINGRLGKDYFVVHDATSFSTSSMDRPSPRSSESSPFWIAATTSRRLAISSKLASSGSCSTVSSTIFLAVIQEQYATKYAEMQCTFTHLDTHSTGLSLIHI